MKILMVSGIRTDPEFMWDEIREAFAKRLPEATFHVETEPGCKLREIGRFRSFTKRTAEKYNDGEELLMVGHSLGGVLACAMQPLMQRSRVIGITTVHAPHRFFFGICTHVFGAQYVSAPVLSIQGLSDGLVWWGTKHPKAVRHIRNHANHFHDLWEHAENAELIAEETVRTFFPSLAVNAADAHA